jgi:hypothetical protein
MRKEHASVKSSNTAHEAVPEHRVKLAMPERMSVSIHFMKHGDGCSDRHKALDGANSTEKSKHLLSTSRLT